MFKLIYLISAILTLLTATACTTTSLKNPQFTPAQTNMGGEPGALSSAWADYDNDGDLDLLVTFKTGKVELFRNNNDDFSAIGKQLGLPQQGKGEARAAAWGDYNRDGYLDLYIGSRNGINALYRNDSGNSFTDVAAQYGLDLPGVNTRQVSWIDYDNNGSPDLFIANRSGANYLFRNDGNAFVDISAASGLADARPAVGACWFDYGEDGDLDVFITHQNGQDDALYRNDGGVFTDIAQQLGMTQKRNREDGGVGCSISDFDNDGDLDIFVATYGEDLLYRNDGNGKFSQVAETLGITGAGLMVGASWGDYDNDGQLDLYVTGHRKEGGEDLPDNRLYHRQARDFVNLLPTLLDDADHGVQWADYDRDGDLDLALTDGYGAAGQAFLYRNQLPESRARQSVQVRVLDSNGHATRAGSEVRIYDSDGQLLGARLVPTGDGYAAQGAQPVHFGLSGNEPISIEVRFMTQQGVQISRLDAIPAAQWQDQVFTIKQNF